MHPESGQSPKVGSGVIPGSKGKKQKKGHKVRESGNSGINPGTSEAAEGMFHASLSSCCRLEYMILRKQTSGSSEGQLGRSVPREH